MVIKTIGSSVHFFKPLLLRICLYFFTFLGIIDNMGKEQQKRQFYKIFASLPINLREEVILVIPGKGPISWQVAYLEVDNNTELGAMILEKLCDLKII